MQIPLSTTKTHSCLLAGKTCIICRCGTDWCITLEQDFSQDIYVPAKDNLLVEKDCIFQGQNLVLKYVSGVFTEGGVTIHLSEPTLQIVAKGARCYQTF